MADDLAIESTDETRDVPSVPAARPIPGLAVASLVLGIVGELVSHIPVIGRIPALSLGVIAVGLGIFGVLRNPAGIARSKRGLAVAGLTLGIVSIFNGLLGFTMMAAANAVVSLVS